MKKLLCYLVIIACITPIHGVNTLSFCARTSNKLAKTALIRQCFTGNKRYTNGDMIKESAIVLGVFFGFVWWSDTQACNTSKCRQKEEQEERMQRDNEESARNEYYREKAKRRMVAREKFNKDNELKEKMEKATNNDKPI